MDLERVDGTGAVAYLPTFGGEREKAEAVPDYKPVVFHLLPMTVADYERAGELLGPAQGRDGEICYRLRPEMEKEILGAHVKRIENLHYRDGEAICDGTAFAEARDHVSSALAPLYMEILAAIREYSVLREGERKN